VSTPAGRRRLVIPEGPQDLPVFDSILHSRGVTSENRAAFLSPEYKDLTPWSLWPAAENVVRRLFKAVELKEAIHIHSDYDVDGITSLVMIKAVLDLLGAQVTFSLPHRFEEGYGLHPSHVDEAVHHGARLLLTADNGATAHESLDMAIQKGLDPIVLDHHLCDGKTIPGVLMCNPAVEAPEPLKHLAAAGVAMKVAQGLAEMGKLAINPDSFLRLATMGTLCDQVPLLGENRTITSLGLKALNSPTNLFLTALYKVSGVRLPISTTDITFRIGPRINAAGRLGDARRVVDYFLCRDSEAARHAAEELDRENRLRQGLQDQVTREALERIASDDPVAVLYDPDWHYGVLGIAAAKVVQSTGRPAILLTKEGTSLKGSGRSIPGVDLHAAIHPFSSFLLSFGGHAMAIGLSLEEKDLGPFSLALQEYLARIGTDGLSAIEVDAVLSIDDLTPELLADLQKLQPCGPGNREPLFASTMVTLDAPVQRFGNGHLRSNLRGQVRSMPFIFWNGEECTPLPESCSILYHVDFWNHTPRVSMKGYVTP